ncbi:MAG: prolyl oligopeptidase family serine peptidase [Chromatiales bacterium]|nr:prolyl oligopeptidase family serine peptidase [Chromatiales bacterium]
MEKYLFLAHLTALTLLFSSAVHAKCDDTENEIYTHNKCTKIKTYKSEEISVSPTLLIALHGDSPFHKPSYHYRFARLIAEQSNDLVSVGMLRPGYSDPMDRTSDGVRGDAIGDNYDKTRVDQLAEAIKQLKTQYNASYVVLAGHSGGGAIIGNLIGVHPALVDHAFIVACPCDINAWRSDMYQLTNNTIFDGTLDVISPIERAADVSPKTRVTLFAGEKDAVAKPYLSQRYQSALEIKGKKAELYMIDGDHEIFLNPKVMETVINTIKGYTNRQK